MATYTNMTNFDPALKQIYRQENVEKLTYVKRPLFGMLNKFEGFKGRNMPIVLQYGNPQGRSANFAVAQANYTQVALEDFLLTRVNDYQVARITGETIEAATGDTASFLNAIKTKMDAAMASLSDAIESFLFRNGTGSLAQLHATTAPTVANPMVLTLMYANDGPNFEVNMTIVCSAADGGALHTIPNTTTIDAIDRIAGTITTAYDNSLGGTDWTTSDFLYVQGDALNGGVYATARAKITGLDGWMPDTTFLAANPTIFGVTRTADSRLAGMYHDGSASTIEEALVDAQSKSAAEGGAIDKFLMNNVQYRRLIKELGAKKVCSQAMANGSKGGIANIAYKGVVVDGDYGEISVIPCNKCPVVKSWGLTMSTLTLNTLGPAVKILGKQQGDSLTWLRVSTEDGYEVRIGFRGNLGCTAPIWNCHTLLPTP
jgi:hypothetical protein